MILGLLLAGGDSSRMGKQKARLLIHGEEAWLHLSRKMLAAGCARIHMAIPTRLLAPLNPLVPGDIDLQLHVVPEAQRQRGAIGSLAHLMTLIEANPLARHEACLIAPVDHPYVATETMHILLGSGHPMAIPTNKGRRGHPILLNTDLAHRLRHMEGTLKTLTRDPDLGGVEIPVSDETIHWNLDRPEDYERFGG